MDRETDKVKCKNNVDKEVIAKLLINDDKAVQEKLTR